VQAKEWWNYELLEIIPHNLGDFVLPILEWVKFVVGPKEAFLLQM